MLEPGAAEQRENKSTVYLSRARSSSTTARHLAVPATLLRRIVSLQHARLTLVRLRESVAALLAHALDLADLANGLLKLFHSVRV